MEERVAASVGNEYAPRDEGGDLPRICFVKDGGRGIEAFMLAHVPHQRPGDHRPIEVADLPRDLPADLVGERLVEVGQRPVQTPSEPLPTGR